ncbi:MULTISPECIES: ion transporter [unclassified Moraxella]|uniref:ion transporter n=1 Tax=unclassified Moraxella TaxID=2685852 RepID=UPI003AF9D207
MIPQAPIPPLPPHPKKIFRRYVYDLLHNENYESRINRLVDRFLIALIMANVASVVLSSMHDWYHAHRPFFDGFEHFSIAVFTIEYFLRLWSSAEHKPQYSATHNRLTWIRHPHGIIDFIAIAPAYVNFFVPIDLRYLIVLRLLRLFKLTRYFVALRLLLKVVAKQKESFKAVLLILMILVVLAASGIHLVEHQAQPDKFDSIPKAMWWAVVTLTTVGYGDVVPITPLGKTLGAMMTILGVGLAALPAGILASGLANELALRRERLEMEFREQLLENEIDVLHENITIENLRKEIGLSQEQARMVIDQLLKEQQLQQKRIQSLHFCPHCGHSLHHIDE